mmetsp:Transcript_101/g.111  ORF Transcript_101/g.111 Transcript_101/m.111 type:complete len:112 (-) Transcript_101:813-1148(-)
MKIEKKSTRFQEFDVVAKFKKREKKMEELKTMDMKVSKRVRKTKTKLLEKKDSNLSDRDRLKLHALENRFVEEIQQVFEKVHQSGQDLEKKLLHLKKIMPEYSSTLTKDEQ